MRINELIMMVAVLGMTVGVAAAKEKKSARETTAAKDAPAVAEVTPAEQAEAAPAPVRHVDPVEAALAQAMALSETPAPAKDRSRAKRRGHGQTGLRKFAAAANKIDINTWTHSTRVPVHEPEVHMAVQPLTPVEVSTVIKANLAKLQYCRQRLAARGAAPAGEVSMRFTVLPKGNPVDIEVIAGGPNADKLARCMENRIRGFRFPAADAPTAVDYPLVFDVAGDAL